MPSYDKQNYTKGVKKYKKPQYRRGYLKTVRFARRNIFNSNEHHFKFKFYETNWLAIELNETDVFFSRDFKLSNLANSAELVQLFDLYRINKIVCKICPRYNSNLIYQTASFTTAGEPGVGNTDAGGTNLTGGSNMGHPSIITVIDYDDATTPTTVNSLMEYSTAKKSLAYKDHIRTLVPRIKVDPTQTSISLSKRWISTTAPDVDHFGIKGVVTNIPDLPEQGGNRPMFFIDLEVNFYISMRNTK